MKEKTREFFKSFWNFKAEYEEDYNYENNNCLLSISNEIPQIGKKIYVYIIRMLNGNLSLNIRKTEIIQNFERLYNNVFAVYTNSENYIVLSENSKAYNLSSNDKLKTLFNKKYLNNKFLLAISNQVPRLGERLNCYLIHLIAGSLGIEHERSYYVQRYDKILENVYIVYTEDVNYLIVCEQITIKNIPHKF